MKRLLLAIALLTGCDAVVKEEIVGPSRKETKNVSCRHVGYCYSCFGTGCGFKMSAFCPGNQRAIVEVQQYRRYHESGNVSGYTRETTLETLEPCN